VMPGHFLQVVDRSPLALFRLSGCFSMAQYVPPQLRARPYTLWLPEPSG